MNPPQTRHHPTTSQSNRLALTVSLALLALTTAPTACRTRHQQNNTTPTPSPATVKLSSIGITDEVLVITLPHDSPKVHNWLESTFLQPFSPLGPIEPTLQTRLYTTRHWNQAHKTLRQYRHILFFHPHHPPSIQTPICALQGVHQKTQQQPQQPCRLLQFTNLWAQPQWVYILHYHHDTTQCILHALQTLKDTIRQRELHLLYLDLTHAPRNQQLETQVHQWGGFHIILPKGFQLAYADSLRLFLRRDEGERILGLLFIRQIPPSLKDFPSWRNHQMSTLVLGPFQNDHMITDTTFLQTQPNNWILGLWRMQKAFMGGPFIAHIDTIHHLYAEGFVYQPGKKKRYWIRWLQAIIAHIRWKPAQKQP